MLKIFKSAAKLVFLCLAPIVLALVGLALVFSDLYVRWKRLFPTEDGSAANDGGGAENSSRPPLPPERFRRPTTASIVIPSWNAKDLLEKYLPSVIEAASEADEIIVVDNASTDGSVEFLRRRFPRVRVVEAERNLGFGGGSNLGIRTARNRIAVLLNNDMRATPGFLQALLDGFTDEQVFAVSSQIFLGDPLRRREETGLTSGSLEKGFVRVRHEEDPDVTELYPTFYAGGGSTAYDREKFLELGGFDPLFEPFYLEDTDLSYGAWRRGWKVLYQPRSRVVHEHRATIGKHYSREAILAYLKKNYVLMVWKNIHRWRWLLQHFFYLYGHMVLCWMGRETDTRTSVGAFIMALQELPLALRQRSRAFERATVDDRAVFARTRPSVFRDVFFGNREQGTGNRPELPGAFPFPARDSEPPDARPLNILFVSPYSIYPPIHGGAVFMLEAIRELGKRHNVFVLTFVDRGEEVEPNRSLEGIVRKVYISVRQPKPPTHFGLRSHAEETFRDPRFAALLDKLVFLHDIDVIQFEYAQLAQYRLPLEHTPQCLFEHDVYFRSVGRQLLSGHGGFFVKAGEFLEWLRAVRFEVRAAERFDAIFTCHETEERLLESFLSRSHPPIFSGLRAVIDVSSHAFPGGPREPDSLLFVGNFQHLPNVIGLQYFCREILPLIRERRPSVTFHVVGANVTPEIQEMLPEEGVRLLGQVPDIREPLSRFAVFVCPILTGAGMRVKILEAFASGIPVVSTPLGAEGLSGKHGTHYFLAATPSEFAAATVRLLDHPEEARCMAEQGRKLVETLYDWPAAARKLEAIYRQLIETKAGARRSVVREPSESLAVH
jgi:GT2 family glycosyltransferase/glycosyltransferase involved in cell wall biosynthesis